jgi:septal ring factor EnvC (AmiA/AmiB activator)
MLAPALGLFAFGLFPLGFAALAQAPARHPGEVPFLAFPPAKPPAAPLDSEQSKAEAIKQRDRELEAVRTEQRLARENEAKLRQEVDSIGEDHRKLNQQLLDTASRVRVVEEQIAKTEERLKPLDAKEKALHQSLEGRRSVLAEVLAALQRMGRHPAPALLVRPEDALQSVRSAMMLGAVLPEMRHDAEMLAADLAELAGLRQEIAGQRASLTRDLQTIAEDRLRLSLLIEQRQKQQAETEKALAAERERAAQLARQAEDLKDLIAKLEQGTDRSRRAGRGEDDKAPTSRTDVAALRDPGRLGPAMAFSSAKGLLPMPVNGARIKEFGGPDGLGGAEKGLSIATRPAAQITAPCDGWVVYAGPFRNYGQLLILNAGGGYHVLLAGMERISVDLGQFVVMGEPVAVMGGGGQAAAALAIGSGRPVLYVEFRKDGTPVDPSPWWATTEGEKVRG